MTGDECASAVRCDADGEQKIKEDDVACLYRLKSPPRARRLAVAKSKKIGASRPFLGQDARKTPPQARDGGHPSKCRQLQVRAG